MWLAIKSQVYDWDELFYSLIAKIKKFDTTLGYKSTRCALLYEHKVSSNLLKNLKPCEIIAIVYI